MLTHEKIAKARQIGKIVSHDLRVKILEELDQLPDASPAQLERRRVGPVSRVNYHMKVLEDAECVRLRSVRQVRGTYEHFYEVTPFGRSVLALVATL